MEPLDLIDPPVYYHFSQHPESLSMETLEPKGLYLSHDEHNWSSPHLKDIVKYQVLLKPDVKLKKIYSNCAFEFIVQTDRVLQFMDDGYDGVDYRFGDQDSQAFQAPAVYADYEWVEGPEKGQTGDPSTDQVFLFRATDSVRDIQLLTPSTFDLASQFYEVTLPRQVLPELDDLNIADVRDTPALKGLIRQYSPRQPHWHGCLYEVTDKRFKLRYISVPPQDLSLDSIKELTQFIEALEDVSSFVHSFTNSMKSRAT